MKIGILTYHRSQNFGALLQAIALRKILYNLGHEPYFIDYWPNYHKKMYKVIDWDLLKLPHGIMSLFIFVRSILLYNNRKKRSRIFENFISRYILKYSRSYNIEEKYDTIIYGSDQIWRKQAGLGNKFNPVYFGDNIIMTDRSISYAASMGIIHTDAQDNCFLKDKLSKFDKVLVREDSLKDLLQDCGISSDVVLDPTLLIDAVDWKEMLRIDSYEGPDYLLFYDLQMGSIDYSIVKEFATKRNLKIKVISGESRSKKDKDIEYIDAIDPGTFVKLLCNAKVVLTSSYHGLVFSLIFNKDFYTVFKINTDRAKSLLTDLSLNDRMLKPNVDKIPDLKSIDYSKVNSIITNRRLESIKMLTEAICPLTAS